jgi:predicted nucleic acid-binding protein
VTEPARRRVLIDTSVVIDLPSGGTASFADAVSVSAISVAELNYGLGATVDPVEQHHRKTRLRLVTDIYDVLPFDVESAEVYGLMANLVRRAGRNPRPRRIDLLIAATAVRHGLSLATRNAADFRHLDRVLSVVPVN